MCDREEETLERKGKKEKCRNKEKGSKRKYRKTERKKGIEGKKEDKCRKK